MATESFAIGTLIIPMDTTYQDSASGTKDNGMITAYGLVYELLDNGIPVKWAINTGKASIDSTDFTASAQDIQTLAPIVAHNYAGGPFIIDSAHATAALSIINAWQVNNFTNVHRATVGFSAPIAITLNRVPRIAVEENNASIMYDYLNDAKIPDSNGNVWTNASPDILDHLTIANYGFFTSATDPCKQLKYDIFLSPHTSDGDWSGSDPDEVAARDSLDTFLRIGGMLHATCHSVETIETIVGPFITSSYSTDNDGDNYFVDEPGFPSAQGVSSPFAAERPGGSVNTWIATYLASAQRLAYFEKDSDEYDFLAAGSYKGGIGSGKIVYEGGHEYKYKMDKAYTDKDNTEMLFLRYVLDSVLFSVGKPRIVLNVFPQSIPATVPTTVAFFLQNDGGSDAVGASASITLTSGAVYNMDATIPPTTAAIIGGQWVLTWDSTALAGNTGPGTILNFTATITPALPGVQSVADYTASFDDGFNESYSIDYCTSLNVTPGAAPFVVKLPPNQSVNPNDIITWTITGGNNGTLALNSVVVTDTLPLGLTFIGAVPPPTTVIGNVITWNLPPIPPLTPLGFTITLQAQAPPATTATYINNVTLTGTDTSPASYSVSDTAQVNVNNRPPTVTVTNPNGGELICNDTTVTWTASDPDGDPLTYTVQYSADGGTNWTTLAAGLVATSYFWDTSGLPSGSNYLVKVIASDGELTGEDTSDGTFTIDNTPPTVNWVSPLNGSFLTTSPYTLEASATDNVGVSQVEFLYSSDGIVYTSIAIDTTPVGNIYSANWEFDTLSPGAYKLKAIATDTCGKTSEAIIDVSIDLPPEVTVTSPNGGELICPPGTNILWDASHPMGAPLTYSLYYSANGGLSFTLIVNGLSGTCPCSYFWDTSSLPSGTNYVVKVVATDGVLSSEDVSDGPFTIDNTPPTVNWVSPTDGELLDSSPVVLEASATDNVGVTQVEFFYSPDGISYTSLGIDTTPVGNIYSVSWDFSTLPGGNYWLRAVATDECGETGEDIIEVTADLPPEVTVISPNGGEIVCPDGINILWDASDPNGDPLNYSILYSSDGGSSYTVLVTGLTGICPCSYFWDTSGLPSGDDYMIKIVASDGILSAEDVSDGPFTIDNTPPVINFISPIDGSYIRNTVIVSATATDNVSVSEVRFEYSDDGGIIYNLIASVFFPIDHTYAANWNTITVPDGDYLLRATAFDQCDNSSEQIIAVTVDNTPPEVEILSPPDGSVVFGTVPILVSAQDNECLAKVELYIDGQLVHTELEGEAKSSDFIFDWDTNEYSEGSHVVRAVATDCAGLTDETVSTYIVDNLPDHYTQLLIDGYLTIPDLKPDVERIISLEVIPEVENIKIISTIDGSKVIVSGFVEMDVTYVATGGTQAVHFAHFIRPFLGFILWPDLPLDAELCPVILIEHEQHHLIDPRTIKKDIVLFVGVRIC